MFQEFQDAAGTDLWSSKDQRQYTSLHSEKMNSPLCFTTFHSGNKLLASLLIQQMSNNERSEFILNKNNSYNRRKVQKGVCNWPFVISEMSTELCPVDMRWNGKEHFVIPNQELHEEGRQLMEAALVKNEKRSRFLTRCEAAAVGDLLDKGT